VHRDIKPENIPLHEGHAVVADFGIGKALQASLRIITAGRPRPARRGAARLGADIPPAAHAPCPRAAWDLTTFSPDPD